MSVHKAFRKDDSKLYDSIAAEWDSTRKNAWREFEFARGLLGAEKILDAGCGNGRLVQWLRENGFEGDYLGVDNSAELLGKARENFPNESFEKVDLREYSQPDRFEAIACVAVLHHLESAENRLKVLQNLHTNLCSDGKIFLTTWNLFQARYWKYLLKARSRDCRIPFADRGERFVHAFTKSELRKLLRQAGFREIEVFYAKHSQKAGAFSGRNLIALAQK